MLFFNFDLLLSVVEGVMKKMKSLADLLGRAQNTEELYTTDQKKRETRKSKGYYTNSETTFDFIFLLKSWEEVVGELLAKNSLPLKIKYNTLYICTKHAVFAQEMGFLSQEIIQKIEAKFSGLKGKIKKIKFLNNEKVFNFKEDQKFEKLTPEKKRPSLHPFSPEYKHRQFKANELFQDIEDEEVRLALKNFYLS